MLDRNTIREVNAYAGFLPLQISELVAETNTVRRQRRDQCMQQVRAASAQGRHVEISEPDIHQDRARARANEEMLVRPAQRRYSLEQPQFLQHTRGVGPKHHTRAYLAKLVRPFVDRCFDTCAVKRDGCGYAADTTTDGADIEFKMTHCLFCLCLRENLRARSGQSSLRMLDTISTRSWLPSLD